MKRFPILCALAALSAAALSAPPPVWAQAPSDAALSWRVTSRLGYGPTPERAQATRDANAAMAWSLAQIDAAKAASAQPPKVPPPLAHIALPTPEVVQKFREERENRADTRADPASAAARQERRDMARVTAQAAAETGRPMPAMQDLQPFSRDMAQGIAAWRLMACSDPSLEQPMLARMTEFWFNHFNVFVGKGQVRPFVASYVLHAIRPNALGKFEDLLMATAKHPAMLFYLDQNNSVAEGTRLPFAGAPRGLNENYARELLELHTLGVNGGYTQNDVRELARILTGWGVGLRDNEPFRFAERAHDRGTKTLLGQSFTGKGLEDGEAAIRMLARHPATAERVARRLAQWFVADAPSAALVDRLSAQFKRTQGDIAAVMKLLVASPEFLTVQPDSQLVKTPLDTACSTLLARTASGQPVAREELQRTAGFLAQAGQGMHAWQTPDGYKTDAATWLAAEALTRRIDYVLQTADSLTPTQIQWLHAYVAPRTLERVAKEPSQRQAGLVLASPEFMTK